MYSVTFPRPQVSEMTQGNKHMPSKGQARAYGINEWQHPIVAYSLDGVRFLKQHYGGVRIIRGTLKVISARVTPIGTDRWEVLFHCEHTARNGKNHKSDAQSCFNYVRDQATKLGHTYRYVPDEAILVNRTELDDPAVLRVYTDA